MLRWTLRTSPPTAFDPLPMRSSGFCKPSKCSRAEFVALPSGGAAEGGHRSRRDGVEDVVRMSLAVYICDLPAKASTYPAYSIHARQRIGEELELSLGLLALQPDGCQATIPAKAIRRNLRVHVQFDQQSWSGHGREVSLQVSMILDTESVTED